MPTIGFNCEKIRALSGKAKGTQFLVWDVGKEKHFLYIRQSKATLEESFFVFFFGRRRLLLLLLLFSGGGGESFKKASGILLLLLGEDGSSLELFVAFEEIQNKFCN